MDRPPPDPAALLGTWMEWERGETPPGRVISALKTGGLRALLEGLAAAEPVDAASRRQEADDTPDAETWAPVV